MEKLIVSSIKNNLEHNHNCFISIVDKYPSIKDVFKCLGLFHDTGIYQILYNPDHPNIITFLLIYPLDLSLTNDKNSLLLIKHKVSIYAAGKKDYCFQVTLNLS